MGGRNLSTLKKSIDKFFRIPIPNDITFDEFFLIAKHFGFEKVTGNGGHGVAIRHIKTHIKIPIPVHGNTVKEAYIKQLKDAIAEIDEL